MSSMFGIIVFVGLATSLLPINGQSLLRGWTEEEPANCPHVNKMTHVCSFLQSTKGICQTRKCCSNLRDHANYERYGDEASSDESDSDKSSSDKSSSDESTSDESYSDDSSDDETSRSGGHHGGCSLCFSNRICTLYKCYRTCCDGYEKDIWEMCNIPDPPKINNCPTGVVNLGVSSTNDEAVLDNKIPYINAYDSKGNKLEVKYRPEKVHHCHCSPSLNLQTTVQAFAKDSHGGIATCSFNVSVKDTFPPRFTFCPKDVNVSEGEMVQWKQPTPDDNVGVSRVSVPYKINGEVFPVGVHTLTYQVWDHDGNTASCNFKVVVTRDPPRINNCPTAVLHLNTTFYTDTAVLKELTTGIQAYDSEDNKIQVLFHPTTVNHCKCSDYLNKQYTIQASATDDYGNFVRCSFKIIVKDALLPHFSFCPEDINVTESEHVTWKEPVYTDNVGILRRSVNMENGQVFPVGNHSVTYDVADFDNNTASCRFNISVAKAKPDPPKIQNCPTEVVEVNTSYYNEYAYIDDRKTDIAAFDADGNKLQVKYVPETIQHCRCYDVTSNDVTVHAETTDSHGNKETCQFKVTVKDIYKPLFTFCPSNIYVSENERASWQEPTYHDNVEVAESSVSGPPSGQFLAVGNHTVHYKVWDFDRNYASCSFNISVYKEVPKPPRIVNCPTKVLHLNTVQNHDQAILSEGVTSIYAHDHGGNKLKVKYEPKMVRHCHCYDSDSAETTVHASVVDGEGVNETCTFNVTVLDIYRPVITNCPQHMKVSEGEKVEWKDPTVDDNVEVVGIEVNRKNGAIFAIGRHTVSYLVWDYDLNNASCTFNVTVEKRSPPKIHNCPYYGLYLNTPASGYSLVLGDNTTSIEAYDGEENKLKVTYRPNIVRHCFCENSASNEILAEALATDQYGNIATCSFRVFVLDQVKPLILHCPENILMAENEVATWREPEYYDNVKVLKVSVTGRKRGTVFPVGNHRVAYEIWDYDGNFATCQFNVTVARAKCSLECFNGGLCSRNGNNDFCRCTPDFVGKQCENKYILSNTCPDPQPFHGICDVRCSRNSDCNGENVCCQEGCSRMCRPPKTQHCQYKGKQYMVNETYSPEPCTTCICNISGEMVCSSMLCSMPKCVGGRQPISKPNQCCLTCPEEDKPRITCPVQTVHLNTRYYSNMTLLKDDNTSVMAYDSFGRKLQVNYRPPFVYHCNCHNALEHATTVEAYATDYHGNIATCSFKVVVRDIYPPVVFSCPDDVFVFEKEVVKWLQPNSADNVGIANTSCSSQKNGETFPVGEHRISCDIRDYDDNTASCHFLVSVTRDDTSVEDLPVGLRDRFTGEKNNKLSIILPIFGAILLIILVLVVIFCCRKWRVHLAKKKYLVRATAKDVKLEPGESCTNKSSSTHKRPSASGYSSSVSSRTSTGPALSIHSNIYAVPDDVGIRPPQYTTHPGYSPPPYSISGSVKDVTYISLPVSAYHNPEYDVLSARTPSAFVGSVSRKSHETQ